MRTPKIHFFLLLLLFLNLIPGIAEGGALTTRLEGVVTDAVSGRPLGNARIQLGNGEFIGETNSAGRFFLEGVPLGDWRLVVSRLGYRTSDELRVTLIEDLPRPFRIRLQPEPIVLPGQRVTGVKTGDDFNPQPAAILTVDDIRNAGFHNIVEALASLPGVEVNAGYSATGVQQVTVRGESGKRIAVTLDGVTMADGIRGETDLSVIPLSAVETIEVHRGGNWGDAALGGSLDISTRKIFPAERIVSGGYGSFDDWQTSATVSNSWRSHVGYLVTGEMTGRGGQYTYANTAGRDSTRSNTGRVTRKLFAKLGGRVAGKWDWGFSTLFSEGDRGSPGALFTSTTAAELRDRRRMVTGNIGAAPHDLARISVRLAVSDYRTHYEDSVTFRSHSQFDETTYLAHASIKWGPFVRSLLMFSVGGEIFHREVTGVNYLVPVRSFGTVDRTANAAWLQSIMRSPRDLPGWIGHGQLVAGMRYDRDGQSPDCWAPKIGAAWGWGIPVMVNATANWGRSFRRPLLTSMFWKEDAFSTGNPDLEPEKAREWDVGLDLSPPRTNLTAGVRFFDRAYDGFIEWEKRYGGSWAPINLPRATLVGREDAVSWSAFRDRLGVEFFHTLMWPINEDPDRNYNGKFLLFRAKHAYQAKLRAALRGMQVRLDARWVSERYRRKQNTKPLPAYRWFDASIRQTVQWHDVRANVMLKVENLTNEPVELLEGYPLPGQSVHLGFEFQF